MTAATSATRATGESETATVWRPRLALEGGLIGAVLGALIVAPWAFSNGYLLLLDWVSGPSQALTPGIYGLSGSALDAVPFRLATQLLREVVGPQATAWLIVWVFFPVAGAGIANAASVNRWRAYPAVLLFLCNPFVVDRVRVGHVSFLLGVALLPWLFAAARDARERGSWFAVRPALWFALAMACNPHAAFLGGTVLLAVALLPRPTWRDVSRTVLVVVSAALVYLYAIAIWLSNTSTIEVTDADLDAYQTAPGPGGLLPTVVSLHGYWRDPAGQVRDVLGPVVMIALFVLVVASVILGLTRLTRIEPSRGWPMVALTAVGLLLGAGVGGPLGELYRVAFDVVPLFEAMREQQKWLALAVLGYSIGFGAAVQWLRERQIGSRPLAPGALCAVMGLLPLVMGFALFWGLGGSIHTSQYPPGWYEAQGRMGEGQGSVLFLPWHAYQPFQFTDGRTVATPAAAFFSRPVLSSDAVELPGLRTDSTSLRMQYLDRVLAAAGSGDFARLVAPLGVEYIVVADSESEYAWLAEEPHLEQVQRSPGMTTYRVEVAGTGRVETARYADVFEAMRLARRLGTEALLEPGAAAPDVTGARSEASGGLTAQSPTVWQLAAGNPGWVVVPVEYSAGWELNGRSGWPTTAGTLAIQTDQQSTTIEYAPWQGLRLSIVLSLMFLAMLILGGVLEHWRQLRLVVRGDEAGTTSDRTDPSPD